MRHRSFRTRPRSLAATAGMALALVVAGCGEPTATSPPTTATTTTTASRPTLDTVSYVNEARQARAEGRSPWFCTSQGLGGSMDHGHENGLANDVYAGKKKGTLSPEDCDKVATMFDEVIAKVKPFRTRGDLKRTGGFSQSVQFVPGLGTHDVVRGGQGAFATGPGEPPSVPMFLQYDGDGDDAQLAGLSWLTFSATGPPEGFPGDNDWWHTHMTLCYKGTGNVVGNEISDEECRKLGGVNRALPGVWMSHAWIIPGYEDRYDVFSGAFMCLKGSRPPAPGDHCHDDHSDPEHPGGGGHTPGMDHSKNPMPGMDHSHPSTTAG